MSPTVMHADAPLTDETDDLLDRRNFAAAVAHAIEHRSDRSSIVLGIYGPWGDGKTSVLNWINKRLDRAGSGVVVVPFNPWLIRDEAAMLPAFFATLATAVGRRLGGRTEQIANLLRRYGRALSGISLGVPGASIDPGTAAEAVGTALADRSLEDMKVELEGILREEGRRLIVVIDDIDRLDDAEIHVVFKLVKLAAAFEGISYVLAFDDEKVAAALATRYSHARGDRGRDDGGYDFLEKIVQVPLRLPRARKEAIDDVTLSGLQSALADAGVEIDEAAQREFSLRYSQGLSPAIMSVRVAKRYANAAGFAIPLLKGETDPIDVLTIEGINACYPALYAAIREHPAWFLLPYEFHLSSRDDEIKARQRERLEGVLTTVDPALRDAAQGLVTRLFPQTEALWTNFGATDDRERWAEQQRVCSEEYFDRYFSYAVASSEPGDRELDAALEEPSAIRERIAALVEEKGTNKLEALLRKLGRRSVRLDESAAEGLIEGLVDLGPRVSEHNRPLFGVLNIEDRTASIVAELLLRLPRPRRNRVASRVVDRAIPLVFGTVLVHWAGIRLSREDQRRALEEDEQSELVARLAKRIVSHAKALDRPMWSEERGLYLMYRARDGGQAQAMRAHVRSWLRRDPSLVTNLLWAAAGVAYGGDLGMAIQQDLTDEKYAGLGEIADLKDIRRAVTILRGNGPAPADFPTVRYGAAPRASSDTTVLDQFAWQEARATRPVGTGARTRKSPTQPRPGQPASARTMTKGKGGRRDMPTLQDEIAAVLDDAGVALTSAEIAGRIRDRGLYVGPRRGTPLDGRQVNARVSKREYRERFVRTGGRIGLRVDDAGEASR